MHTAPRRRVHVRRIAVTTAATATTAMALFGGGVAPAAAAGCGAQAAAQPFIDHMNSAHLERSPIQQAKDLFAVDAYVLAHTVLAETMLGPLLPALSGAVDPFVQHLYSAHLERSPVQQAKDLADADDYVLAHTVLVESMLQPMLSGCADSAPAPTPMHGAPSAEPAAPAAPAAPVAPAATAIGIHNYTYDPKAPTVAAGSTVTWTNHDDDAHTVTGSGMKSKSFGSGETFSYTFATAGTFAYACALHPQMKGSVTVQ